MTGGTLNAASDYALNCAYGGEANIQGGTVGTQGKGLCIGNPDRVKLSGGTYATICIVSNYGAQKVPLSTILADGRAAYGPDGPITRDTVDAELTGPIIVKECEHDGVTVQEQGNGKHGLDCPYCGYHYEHTTNLTATASGNNVTLNGGCGTEGCGYQTTLGTASFTFPKVTYGQSGDVTCITCTWDRPAGYYVGIEVGERKVPFNDAEVSLTLAQLFGSTKVTAGKHAVLVDRLGDDHYAPLDIPPKGHLGGGFSILLPDGGEDGMGEDAVLALGKRPPSLGNHAVLLHQRQGVLLLEEGVELHLVHHGLDFHRLAQVGQHMGIAVAHADGINFALYSWLISRMTSAMVCPPVSSLLNKIPSGDIISAATRHSTSTTAITAPPPAAGGAMAVRMADTAPRRADVAAFATGRSTVAAVLIVPPAACTAR